MTTGTPRPLHPRRPKTCSTYSPTRPPGPLVPVAFDIEEIDSERLQAGTHARVAGSLAGREIRFDVAVMEAEPERLLLQACGPVGLDVEYTIAPAPQGRRSTRRSPCAAGGGSRRRFSPTRCRVCSPSEAWR